MMLLSIGLSVAFVIIVLLAVAMVLHIGNYERTVDRFDERADGVARAISALRGLVDAAAEEVVTRLVDGRVTATEARLDARMSTLQDHESRIDDAFAAISGMHKRIGVAVKDADIARGLAMQMVEGHATCALCGKVGHVADMEGMLMLELHQLPVSLPVMDHGHVGDVVHLHPECLVDAGCERVDAVAGGWRQKKCMTCADVEKEGV